ncbi:hypothetical protein VaNZ11_003489 [Volvox africanus]|uniref:Uncharacterized protein n=1 Tax=Volvox africanus TaxID=51714 RepID=A0ABQ5RUT5_9CHLO|nr:hypothetical protein VaNZ11_003489 [Volvox africanus]
MEFKDETAVMNECNVPPLQPTFYAGPRPPLRDISRLPSPAEFRSILDNQRDNSRAPSPGEGRSILDNRRGFGGAYSHVPRRDDDCAFKLLLFNCWVTCVYVKL